MGNKTRPLHILSIRDSLQIERHTQTESKNTEKDVSCKWEEEKAVVSMLTPDETDFKTKAIPRDKEGPRSFTSGYLSEDTQSINQKRHMQTYVYFNIIYNNQDIKATSAYVKR